MIIDFHTIFTHPTSHLTLENPYLHYKHQQTWLFKIKKTADRWKKNLSNGNNEQQQNEPIVGQYISTSANVPTTQEPTSAHNSALHQNRSSTIKQPTPKVDKPAATCSD